MQPKPIFIGFAAAILILVVAAASFSAGLYLGQRGYVADLQYQVPQNGQGGPDGIPPQSGPQPQVGPPGAPSWPPDVMGTLVSRSADSITFAGPQRQFTIPVNVSTRYTDEMGNPLDPATLQVGDVIAIFGRDVATLVMRLPPSPNAP